MTIMKQYKINGYIDQNIEVNFNPNTFNNIEDAYNATQEHLEYCDVEIVEESTGLRILLTSNEIEIWNKTPYVHFKQQRPRTYEELVKIIDEIFLS